MHARMAAFAGFLVIFGAVQAGAQTTLPCVRLPFQATNNSILTVVTSAIVHGTVSIPLPATPIEIEQITFRVKTMSLNNAVVYTAQLTTKLYGQTVTHGIEIPYSSAGPSLIGIPSGRDGALSRQVTFYADPSSTLNFDFEVVMAANGDQTRIDVGVAGRAVSPGCWIGPQ